MNITNRKSYDKLLLGNESFTVYSFMRSKLDLTGIELHVYAIIYGFFKNSLTFTGSREYLAYWSGACIRSIDNALASLLKKGYIEVVNRRRCGNEYTINIESLHDVSMHSTMLDIWYENKELEAKRSARGETPQ